MIHHSKFPGKVLKKLSVISDFIDDEDFETALNGLQDLPDPYQNHWDVMLLKAYVLSQLSDYEGAFLVSSELFEYKPNNPMVAYNYALTCVNMEFPILAWRTLESIKLERVEPELTSTIKGLRAEVQKDYKNVRAVTFLKVTPAVKEEVMLLHDLSRKDLFLEKIDEAAHLLRQLLSLAPEFSPAINNLAEIMFSQGDLEEAARLNERAMKADPENTFSLYSKARFDLLSGKSLAKYPLTNKLSEENFLRQLEGLVLHSDFETLLALVDSSKEIAFSPSDAEEQLSVAEIVILSWDAVSEDVQKRFENIRNTAVEIIDDNGLDAADFEGGLEIERFFPLSLQDKILEFAEEHQSDCLSRLIAEKFPVLTNAIKIGLKFGDWEAVETVLEFCEWAWNPELEEAIRIFASSKRLDFDTRLLAAELLKKHNPELDLKVWNGDTFVDVESGTRSAHRELELDDTSFEDIF